MSLRRAGRVLGYFFLVLLLVSVSLWLYLHRSDDGSSAPRGFGSERQIYAALISRAVRLVDMNPPTPPEVVERLGVEFRRIADRPLFLDLYSPTNRQGKNPGLIFIHGGGWKSGRRQDYRVYTSYFATRGFVAATIDYRLVPEGKVDEQLSDCQAAIQWMRTNAVELGVDPDRIAVIGGSAGGHLSLLVGYTAAQAEAKNPSAGPNPYRVSAVVDLYGPTDLTSDEAKDVSLVKNLMGGTMDSAPERWRQASPLFLVGSNSPPTLIFHGSIDTIVNVKQSDVLAKKLEGAGVMFEYERLEGWPHTMDATRPMNHYCRQRIEQFLRRVWK